jgi:hypothetical protein
MRLAIYNGQITMYFVLFIKIFIKYDIILTQNSALVKKYLTTKILY